MLGVGPMGSPVRLDLQKLRFRDIEVLAKGWPRVEFSFRDSDLFWLIIGTLSFFCTELHSCVAPPRGTCLKTQLQDIDGKKDTIKSPATGRIQTHDLLILRHLRYRCATTSARDWELYNKQVSAQSWGL